MLKLDELFINEETLDKQFSDLGFDSNSFLLDILPLGSGSRKQKCCGSGGQNVGNPDPGSQNVENPDPESRNVSDPDPKHWKK